MGSYYLSNVAFFGFAVYSVFFIVFKRFPFYKKNTAYSKIDQAAITVVGLAGLLYASIWIYEISTILMGDDASHKNQLLSRMTSKYAIGFWLQPLTYIFFSQIVWFKKIAKHSFLRGIIAFFLFLNFEKFVIIATTIHRDYLPSSWTMFEDYSIFGWIISGWLIKLVFFASMVIVTYYIKNRRTL
jgi:hypothetical protein